jgi:drug/metabolite transporter (DMT)-like permease
MSLLRGNGAGMLFALSASFFWTLTPIFLASAGRRIGAYQVNILRLGMAGCVFALIAAGIFIGKAGVSVPLVPGPAFLWLALSGISGLVLGDMLYITALTKLGPRRTTLMMTLSPVVPVIIAWIFIDEKLALSALAGIALIIGGIVFTAGHEAGHENDAEPGHFSVKGMAIVIGGSLFHGSGAVMARQAFLAAPEIDPVLAAAIRVLSAAIVLCVVAAFSGSLFKAVRQLQARPVLLRVSMGALSGTVIGMVFYISALKYTPAGIATTLSGLSPMLILPIIALRYRVRIRKEAIIGTIIAVGGVAVMVFTQ